MSATEPPTIELAWRKSLRSNENGGACVEAASDGARFHIRDSKSLSQLASFL
jgi:hypothetical protein